MIITDKQALILPCADASTEDIPHIISLLEKELEDLAKIGREGIGLSAPQIGIYKKVAIIRVQKNGYYDLSINLINARISKSYDPIIFNNEIKNWLNLV
jgi:peptide deformylase